VLIPLGHGLGEATDDCVAGPTTDVPLYLGDEVRNTGQGYDTVDGYTLSHVQRAGVREVMPPRQPQR